MLTHFSVFFSTQFTGWADYLIRRRWQRLNQYFLKDSLAIKRHFVANGCYSAVPGILLGG
jgi:hypothetical protein